MVKGERQRQDDLEELRAHRGSAMTYPLLLLIESLQFLLLGAQLPFQLPASSLESLCILPNQRRRRWVQHPAPLVSSLVSMHLNSLASWTTNPFSLGGPSLRLQRPTYSTSEDPQDQINALRCARKLSMNVTTFCGSILLCFPTQRGQPPVERYMEKRSLSLTH